VSSAARSNASRALQIALLHASQAVVHQPAPVLGALARHIEPQRPFRSPDAVPVPGADPVRDQHRDGGHGCRVLKPSGRERKKQTMFVCDLGERDEARRRRQGNGEPSQTERDGAGFAGAGRANEDRNQQHDEQIASDGSCVVPACERLPVSVRCQPKRQNEQPSVVKPDEWLRPGVRETAAAARRPLGPIHVRHEQ
jgi:hypothetical protein